MADAVGLDAQTPVLITGRPALESLYPVSALATASVSTVAIATAALVTATGSDTDAEPVVDRALCDAWFGFALRPAGWSIPSPWDPIAGDYPAGGGWIRLHTNAPRHRAAALRVLGVTADPEAVAAAVARWDAGELEDAVVAADGCAAMLRDPEDWAAHPQGMAVAREPLADTAMTGSGPAGGWRPEPGRPLAGLRVLDLTRVLAGPVATRVLAGLGADVLRVDPPDWDEPGVVPEMTVGKRSTRLDARSPSGHATLMELLGGADVLVHGYRRGALAGLGFGEAERAAIRPGLIDVSLDAYGWTGPWASRRGFDSLVQMSTGIAGAGMRAGISDRPTPLPVQALDHATGYLMAAAVLTALTRFAETGRGVRSRFSLARTAAELERVRLSPAPPAREAAGPASPALASAAEPTSIDTAWGAATLLPVPFRVGRTRLHWERGPGPLGGDPPEWQGITR
jgi:crotonobetainyl-CoA:carnitine CoA-transferase CaiB-like acyl-CoA transferase